MSSSEDSPEYEEHTGGNQDFVVHSEGTSQPLSMLEATSRLEDVIDDMILEIEGETMPCNRKALVDNSDYFRAMLEGHFKEKNETRIKLQGINFRTMGMILMLLADETYVIEENDVLPVLQAASMLQFEKIASMCTLKLTETLMAKNCLKVWLVAEQLSIKPLYLKAKLLALLEFMVIKDLDCILELTVEELTSYLGNVYIKTDNEFTIFQTAMRWWYDNSQGVSVCHVDDVILRLLRCVNLLDMSDTLFSELMMYPDISRNSKICEILTCFKNCKKQLPYDSFSEETIKIARSFYKVKDRTSAKSPCILTKGKMRILPGRYVYQAEDSDLSDPTYVVYRDRFKRKRVSQPLRIKSATSDDQVAIYYDKYDEEFKELFKIDASKCHGLEGFSMQGYKEFVLLYGGEYKIGRGEWNFNLWVYDTIKEKWERMCKLPCQRRHFETCTVDSRVYIMCGTGEFRIMKENMLWYDYKQGTWSREYVLPVFDRKLKCCCFNNCYFVFSVQNRCGYFFVDTEFLSWRKVDVVADEHVFDNLGEFALFSYKGKLYVKGKLLLELELVKDDKLVILSQKVMTSTDPEGIEIALCGPLLYSYFKYQTKSMLELEEYNIETGETRYIFEDIPFGAIGCSSKIFTVHNYNLLEGNKVIYGDCDV